MPYEPLAPNLPPRSVFTTDHIAHLDRGIQGAREYAETVAAAGVSDTQIDAAITKAVQDGRLPTGGGNTPVTVVESSPGVYDITGTTITEVAPGVYEIGA